MDMWHGKSHKAWSLEGPGRVLSSAVIIFKFLMKFGQEAPHFILRLEPINYVPYPELQPDSRDPNNSDGLSCLAGGMELNVQGGEL